MGRLRQVGVRATGAGVNPAASLQPIRPLALCLALPLAACGDQGPEDTSTPRGSGCSKFCTVDPGTFRSFCYNICAGAAVSAERQEQEKRFQRISKTYFCMRSCPAITSNPSRHVACRRACPIAHDCDESCLDEVTDFCDDVCAQNEAEGCTAPGSAQCEQAKIKRKQCNAGCDRLVL